MVKPPKPLKTSFDQKDIGYKVGRPGEKYTDALKRDRWDYLQDQKSKEFWRAFNESEKQKRWIKFLEAERAAKERAAREKIAQDRELRDRISEWQSKTIAEGKAFAARLAAARAMHAVAWQIAQETPMNERVKALLEKRGRPLRGR